MTQPQVLKATVTAWQAKILLYESCLDILSQSLSGFSCPH